MDAFVGLGKMMEGKMMENWHRAFVIENANLFIHHFAPQSFCRISERSKF